MFESTRFFYYFFFFAEFNRLIKCFFLFVLEITLPKIEDFVNSTLSQDDKKHHFISCKVTGNSKPTIKWKVNNLDIYGVSLSGSSGSGCENLVPGVYLVGGRDDTIVICSINFKKHSGSYECIASNKVGTVEKKMHLTVTGRLCFGENFLG